MDKHKLLQQYWGYASFRKPQASIIDAVLQNKDSFAVLPTGAGKSLCYQLPALLLSGTTLVVTPLIALMEDQVKDLKNRGIKAMYFEAATPLQSIVQQIDNCIHGNYALVYVSPERLQQSAFLERISQANIVRIAIDEAHCISSWGHDFRPSYRKIKVLRTLFPEASFLALTASATPEVAQDILEQLEMPSAQRFSLSFERSNLFYKTWVAEDKWQAAHAQLQQYPGSGIIYCFSRIHTERLAAYLKQQGVAADYFHGGMEAEEKKDKLAAWQSDKTRIMVATTAFGMGIDKKDVRLVVHLDMPESIENYYQETGRAGRDGLPATAVLLLHSSDQTEMKMRFIDHLPTVESLQKTYKHLCNYFQIAYGEGPDRQFDLALSSFCEHYGIDEKQTLATLRLLEKAGVLKLKSTEKKLLEVHALVDQSVVLQELRQNTNAKSNALLHYLLRAHEYFFSAAIQLDVSKMGQQLQMGKQQILKELQHLQQKQLIRFTDQHIDFVIYDMQAREDAYTLAPLNVQVKANQARKKSKLNAMYRYAWDTQKCKRNQILTYFGELKTDNCSQCSAHCCSATPHIKELLSVLESQLKSAALSAVELRQKLYFEPQFISDGLQQLLEDEKIILKNDYKYHWIDD